MSQTLTTTKRELHERDRLILEVMKLTDVHSLASLGPLLEARAPGFALEQADLDELPIDAEFVKVASTADEPEAEQPDAVESAPAEPEPAFALEDMQATLVRRHERVATCRSERMRCAEAERQARGNLAEAILAYQNGISDRITPSELLKLEAQRSTERRRAMLNGEIATAPEPVRMSALDAARARQRGHVDQGSGNVQRVVADGKATHAPTSRGGYVQTLNKRDKLPRQNPSAAIRPMGEQ